MITEYAVSALERTNKSPGKMKLRLLFEILVAFLPIIVLGGLGTSLSTNTFLGDTVITLGYAFSILGATFVLKSHGRIWQDIGLALPGSWTRTVHLGNIALAALFITTILFQVLVLNLPGVEAPLIDWSRFNQLEGNLVFFLLFVVFAWTTITFGEEMFYRAFLITHLGDVFMNSKFGPALALLTSSLIFGLVHLVEGPIGVAHNFIMGLIFGVFYLGTGRNLWVTIIAHGLANTIRFFLFFIGAA